MKGSADKDRQFEALVMDHHVRVRAFVRSLGVDPDWVDDIAQEAFVKAFENWESFDPSRDFGKWVRGIAANIVRNEIRKHARRQRILSSDLADLLLRSQDESEERPEPIRIEAIRDCLSKLRPENLRIVHGRYRDGLSAPELAQRLELSAANVRQILVRIRRQLRTCVEGHVASQTQT